jgi:hypothetical protein
MGMDKRQLDRQLKEVAHSDWIKNLTLLPSVHTQSGGDPLSNKGGAPKKDTGSLSETGANSRSNDSIASKSKKATIADNIISED